MTHQLLQGAKIISFFQTMYGKTVAKGMGCQLSGDPRILLVAFQQFPEALAAHPDASHVHKQGLLPFLQEHIPPDFGQICAKSLDCRS